MLQYSQGHNKAETPTKESFITLTILDARNLCFVKEKQTIFPIRDYDSLLFCDCLVGYQLIRV